jgi:hypothetical protein
MSKTSGTGIDILSPSLFLVDHINTPRVFLTSSAPKIQQPITDYNNIGVEWKVNVHSLTSTNVLNVFGYVVLRNTGNQSTNICNCLVNLQRKSGKNWKTVVYTNNIDTATCMANLASNTKATRVNVVASATSENKSTWTQSSRFVLKSEFFYLDENSTTITSFSKGTETLRMRPGEIKALVFMCQFNANELNLKAGEQLRGEFVTTFENAGSRGGSGSSVASLEADGFPGDERNVRSVPTRFEVVVPTLKVCNSVLPLEFKAVPEEGTTTFEFTKETKYNVEISPTQNVFNEYTVCGIIHDGDSDVTNKLNVELSACVSMDEELYNSLDWSSLTYLDTVFSYRFVRCNKLEECQKYSITIRPTPPSKKEDWEVGDLLTYSKNDWEQDKNSVLTLNFLDYYPQGLKFSYTPTTAGAAENYIKWTSAIAVRTFLGTNVNVRIINGTQGSKNGSLITTTPYQSTNPTTTSAGNYLHQLLSLKLNVDLNQQLIAGSTATPPINTTYKLGDIKFRLPAIGGDNKSKSIITGRNLVGTTINSFLIKMSNNLWKNNLEDMNISDDLASLAESINSCFKNGSNERGQPSAFADSFLTWE